MDLRHRLYDLFDHIGIDSKGFWGRVVRGDGIECFVPEYHRVLRIALLLKLYVKTLVGEWDCSPQLQRYGLRYSIGIGDIRYADKKDDIIDGPAIYTSGRNLDVISRERDSYSAFEVNFDRFHLSPILDSYVALLDNLVNSYSAKQAEVVYYKLWGYKEIDISEIIGIRQSAVNSRSTLANWGLVWQAVRDFENFDFSRVCG